MTRDDYLWQGVKIPLFTSRFRKPRCSFQRFPLVWAAGRNSSFCAGQGRHAGHMVWEWQHWRVSQKRKRYRRKRGVCRFRTFRHEQGDANLKSEQGWQLDASYHLKYRGISFSVSPFVSWFSNYIFLRPTGEWSVLPHAGQIYRYTGAEALFAGTEATVDVDFLRNFNYRISAEYVYTYNCDEHIPFCLLYTTPSPRDRQKSPMNRKKVRHWRSETNMEFILKWICRMMSCWNPIRSKFIAISTIIHTAVIVGLCRKQ